MDLFGNIIDIEILDLYMHDLNLLFNNITCEKVYENFIYGSFKMIFFGVEKTN